jgi:transcription initiation factor TFIIIB Brf1 subunit/transcription initiation factor TFIIB
MVYNSITANKKKSKNMRCYICDSELDEVQFDENNKALPCGSCQEVIADTLADFEQEEQD